MNAPTRWLCFAIALVTSVIWVPAVILTLIAGWAFGLFDEPEEK